LDHALARTKAGKLFESGRKTVKNPEEQEGNMEELDAWKL